MSIVFFQINGGRGEWGVFLAERAWFFALVFVYAKRAKSKSRAEISSLGKFLRPREPLPPLI